MKLDSRPGSALTLVADTTARFADFAPYVGAAGDDGTVTFQAALKDGGAGIFAGDGGPVATVFATAGGPFADVFSHADAGPGGAACAYAHLARGGSAVIRVVGGRAVAIARTPDPFRDIGPLGPTMNAAGTVAFRADRAPGERGVFTARAGAPIEIVADTRGTFAGFEGLPVVTRDGTVVFRADHKDGRQSVLAARGGVLATIAATGERFRALGHFPGANDAGAVSFGATLASGVEGVFVAAGGETTTVADSSGPFESFRGAWINNAGGVVFCATPKGGALGIYRGPDPKRDAILGTGDPLLGSTITEFALNPVSVNDAGQVAIRVRLADGRQLIVRADPAR
jgi:hypothetical protein